MLILEKLGSRYGLVYKFVYKQLWEFQVNNLAHWFLHRFILCSFPFFHFIIFFFEQKQDGSGSLFQRQKIIYYLYNSKIISAELIEIQ